MKSTHLRIGNKIHQFGIEIFVTGGILEKLAEIEANGKICIDLTPIPLTAEWLERFGFEGGKMLFQVAPKRWLSYSYAKEFWIENSDWDELHEIRNVEYVHQLQNLFFALTGTELEVKK